MSFMDILKKSEIHEDVWALFDEIKSGERFALPKKNMHLAHRYYVENAKLYGLPEEEDNFFESGYFDIPLPQRKRGQTKTITETWFKLHDAEKIRKNINRVTAKANPIIKKIEKKNDEIDKLVDVGIEAFDKNKNKDGHYDVIDRDKLEHFLDSPIVEPYRLGLKLTEGKEINLKNPEATARFLGKEKESEKVLRIIEELESVVDNMELVVEVMTFLKQAIQMPQSKTGSDKLVNDVRKMLREWGSGGYDAAKNTIKKLQDPPKGATYTSFFTEKRITSIQELLLNCNKGKIDRTIWNLFIPARAKFDKESGEWSDYVKYKGKTSKDIYYEILNKLGISTVMPKIREGAAGKMKEYFSSDISSDIEEIQKVMNSNKIEDYQFLFEDERAEKNRNIIYKLSNHIMDEYEDARDMRNKMSDSEKEEKTNLLMSWMEILEFMYQVMDITAKLDIVDDRELEEIRSLKGKLSGHKVTIYFDETKQFPNLIDAYDNAEDFALAQEKARNRKRGAHKRTKRYKSEKERMEAYEEEVKRHFKGTITGYRNEINELKERLTSGKEIDTEESIAIRRQLRYREKKIKELQQKLEEDVKEPLSLERMLKDLIRHHEQKISEEAKEKATETGEPIPQEVITATQEKIAEIKEILGKFQNNKKDGKDTNNQNELGDAV